MKLRSDLSLLVLLGLLGCGEAGDEKGDGGQGDDLFFEKVNVDLRGAVHKGPFVVGSSLQISPLNAELEPTGDVFNTETKNDLGEFAIKFEVGGPVRLEATGFYYNEILGELSQGNLTLRALYVPAGAGRQSAYVNLITHLIIDRVDALYREGSAFEAAVSQAEDELRDGLRVTTLEFDPKAHGIEMNIAGGDSDANAYLFVVSSVLAKVGYDRNPAAADAELQNVINALSKDLADGQLSPKIRNEIGTALLGLDVANVTSRFSERLVDSGSDQTAPDMERVIDQDRDGFANADDNCPLHENADQQDGDDDAIGDVCDECPATKCDHECVPATQGAGDTCVERCGEGVACSEGTLCMAVEWVGGTQTVQLCAAACDPLAPSCAQGTLCEPAAVGSGPVNADGTMQGAPADPSGAAPTEAPWACIPTPPERVPAAEGEGCAPWPAACAPGLVCTETFRGMLCTTLCDPSDTAACGGSGPCMALTQDPRAEGTLGAIPDGVDPAMFDKCLAGELPPSECDPITAAAASPFTTCTTCSVGHCLPPAGKLGELCAQNPETCATGLACAQGASCPGGGLCCQNACDPNAAESGCAQGDRCADAATPSKTNGVCTTPAALGEACSFAGACGDGLGCRYHEDCANNATCCGPVCDPEDPVVCSDTERCEPAPSGAIEPDIALCVALPEECTNGVLDPDETDIDCGGTDCRPCGLGERCWADHAGGQVVCEAGLECLSEANAGPMDGVCATLCDTALVDPGCDDGTLCVIGFVDQQMAATDPMNITTGACLPEAAAGEPCSGYGQCEAGTQCFASTDCANSGSCCLPECDALSATSGCGAGEVCVGNLLHAPTSAGACITEPVSCSNGKKDATESDIDCGGTYCERCPQGDKCFMTSDCAADSVCKWTDYSASSVCARACDLLAPDCDTGFGCGSPMSGAPGNGPTYCFEKPASCSDETTNDGETDTDCGGDSLCGPCGDGQQCTSSNYMQHPIQCVDGFVCYDSVCVTTFCEDLSKNYNETAVDCGGSCPRCAAGATCNSSYDCQSNSCVLPASYPYESSGPSTCAPAHCTNGTTDGDETALDCGGSCMRCAVNKTCTDDFDCESFWCNGGTCKTPSCADTVKNGTETDLNCGGSCPTKCAIGKGCRTQNDCVWGSFPAVCDDGTCTTCPNGFQDGDETGTDCGGAFCPACP